MERIARIVIVVALVAAFGIAIWAYPQLPARVPSHWNAAGEVDGYSSRTFGAFGLPLIMLGLTVLLLGLPRIDPLKKNIEGFLPEYHVFVAVFELFFLLIYAQTILWALGTELSINVVMSIGCGALFMCVGWMIGRAKRNFFIGIRTPWTLMNEEVWDRTHALGVEALLRCRCDLSARGRVSGLRDLADHGADALRRPDLCGVLVPHLPASRAWGRGKRAAARESLSRFGERSSDQCQMTRAMPVAMKTNSWTRRGD